MVIQAQMCRWDWLLLLSIDANWPAAEFAKKYFVLQPLPGRGSWVGTASRGSQKALTPGYSPSAPAERNSGAGLRFAARRGAGYARFAAPERNTPGLTGA